MVSVFISFALLLGVVEIHGFNPQQNPANSWVYFGRGLNQREIIDLAKPKEEEGASSSIFTTPKLLETTLESIVTTDGPTKTSSIPTTGAPVPTRDSPPVRNLPETVVTGTTFEPLEETETALPKKEIKEVATSESPVRAKIVVIPKKIIAITDTPSINTEVPTTEIPIIDGIANVTDVPAEKSKESSASSEEAPAPSLRTMLRRIFSGDEVHLRRH